MATEKRCDLCSSLCTRTPRGQEPYVIRSETAIGIYEHTDVCAGCVWRFKVVAKGELPDEETAGLIKRLFQRMFPE